MTLNTCVRSAICILRLKSTFPANTTLRKATCNCRYFHVNSRSHTDVMVEQLAERKQAVKLEVNLKDYEKAFRLHSTWSIAKSLFIFRLCSYRIIVDNSLWV